MGLFTDGKVRIGTELDRKAFEQGLDKMKSSTQKAGATIKNIIVGLGITKLIGSAMNTISNSIDGAISRYDTLNNFPKVMENLGISSEEADKSIKKMSKDLTGLPTTLDQGARAVQRFTSKNGNVAKSTELFLALNNAIIAGGASMEQQASALEQVSQAYARGKPDMQEWRNWMITMPAQLKQVAKAMGYIDADALGEALREGTVSMDEFMEAIIRLNEEGIDGLASFRDQAKTTVGGIATQITNAKTAVTRGVTGIIEAIDVRLKSANLGGIGDLIKKLGEGLENGMKGIAKLISGEVSIKEFTDAGIKSMVGFINGFASKIPEAMTTATNMIVEFVNTFTENIPLIVDSAKNLISNFVSGLIKNIPTLVPAYQNMVYQLAETIVDNLDYILEVGGKLLFAIAKGIGIALPRFLDEMPVLITKLAEKLSDPETVIKMQAVGLAINLALAQGLIRSIPQLLTFIPRIVIGIYSSFIEKIRSINWGEVGSNIIRGVVNGFSTGAVQGFISQKINEFKNRILSKISSVFKIGSPSKLMRDEIGIYLAQGIGVGFADEIDSVYKSMQNAIDLEQAKLQANVETGKVFNSLQNSTPVAIDINADVEMDGTKVGRLVTPVVSKTIKTGGGV